MPSSRRLKITGLVVVLTLLIVLYITNGAKNTYNSPFYTRTVEAIRNRQDAEARDNVVAEEQQRLERVEKIQKEHDGAVSAAAAVSTSSSSTADEAKAAKAQKQQPLAADLKAAASDVASAASSVVSAAADKVKPVAGRKTMKDDRIVQEKPISAAGDDGVAKVGNVSPLQSTSSTSSDSPKSEADHAVELELNDILKKGPIIIFSKTHCPFSRKAKHILLDLYAITPAPYVVELDQHELGPGLQKALEKTTGRRTVPNVLINGRSIGGGDDVEKLHNEKKLVETVQSMGGKRVVSVVENKGEAKQEVKFKA